MLRSRSATAATLRLSSESARSALVELFGQRRFTAGEDLLDRRDLLPVIARVLLGLEPQLVGALFRVEQRFLAARVAFTLGVAEHARGLLLGASQRLGGDALAVGDPQAKTAAPAPKATAASTTYFSSSPPIAPQSEPTSIGFRAREEQGGAGNPRRLAD